MNPAAPQLQRYWDWRAAGNFMGGGAGTGLLLAVALTGHSGLAARLLSLFALALVGGGLFLVWTELGRPWRFVHVLFNRRTSWMTRESFAAAPLALFGLAAAALDWRALTWLAALSGMAFLYCQGRIFFASKGIPVWRPSCRWSSSPGCARAPGCTWQWRRRWAGTG